MDLQLKDKVALITGSTKGIGALSRRRWRMRVAISGYVHGMKPKSKRPLQR